MEWMLLPLKRYAEFSGRSRRKEFWMFWLLTLILGFIAGIIDGVLGLTTSPNLPDEALEFGIANGFTLSEMSVGEPVRWNAGAAVRG